MKMSVTLSLFALIVMISANAQNVGIGTTNPLEKLSVGSNSQFRVDANGNITRINNISYSFPAIQGANQYLKNDGAGNLSWTPAPKPVVRVFSLVNSGTSAWLIDNASDYNATPFNSNPTLTLYRGLTYQFSSFVGSMHPFRIATVAGIGTPYTVGITNNDVINGVLTFTVPMDAPDSLHYYCLNHSPMNGGIRIR
jgi:hypothetical protein